MEKLLTLADIEIIRSRSAEQQIRYLFEESDPADKAFDIWLRKFRLKFSVPISPEELQEAYRKGMIRKEELRDGAYYFGVCRNALAARWSSRHQAFFYQRKKFGVWSVENIKHPVDEEVIQFGQKLIGLDVFVPWLEVEPLSFEQVEIPREGH